MARNLAAQIPLDPEPDMYGKAAARRLPGRLHNRRAGIQPSPAQPSPAQARLVLGSPRVYWGAQDTASTSKPSPRVGWYV